MRWTRARVATLCGSCHRHIVAGEPLLQLAVGVGAKTGRIVKVRCTTCVGPAPPDLPERIELEPPRPALDMTRIGLLPLQWTREPGEEG